MGSDQDTGVNMFKWAGLPFIDYLKVAFWDRQHERREARKIFPFGVYKFFSVCIFVRSFSVVQCCIVFFHFGLLCYKLETAWKSFSLQ